MHPGFQEKRKRLEQKAEREAKHQELAEHAVEARAGDEAETARR